MFDKDITIINKWFNKETKQEEYKINHVKGFWSSNEGISINNTSLIKSDGVVVRILMTENGYSPPINFQKNPNGWTLKNDDYIAKGIIESIDTISTLKDNYEVMKITNIAIKDYGSTEMQHFEISGS